MLADLGCVRIAGCIVARGKRPPEDALEAMAAALSHRGPDDHGIAVNGNVGLVNTRLAIVDPGPAGHQPMADPGGRWLLTYNGEIFNHLALRAELPVDDWRGGSDTETLLAALAAWDDGGAGAMQRFLRLRRPRHRAGPTAAGARSLRRQAALPRALGRRPLVRERDAGADRGRGAGAERAADVLGHAATVRMAPRDGRLRSRRSSAAPGQHARRGHGHACRQANGAGIEPADAVDPDLAADLAGRSRAELAERLEAALRGAVRRRLLGDAPVGSACSGGLDSTLVTALARDEDPSIVAFNASLVDESVPTRGAGRSVAAAGSDVELETVRVTASDWRRALVEHRRPPRVPALVSAAARSRLR